MTVAELLVKIDGDATGAIKATNQTGGAVQGLVGSAGIGAAAIAAAIAAAVAAVAVGAYKIGEAFDEAADTIRVGTGATGEALEVLKQDFRAVVADVPVNFADASTAVAELNTRLGITGEPLQALSGQFLELTRLLGGDLKANLAAGTRLFGDWSVAGAQQAETLDYLFRVSQSTGIGFDRLSQMMVQFGAPLRGMGFDMETAAAMMGKFEKEGVNTEMVLGSLKIGLGRMAKEGITDASAAFGELQARVKAAGTDSEATALAMEYFGAKAGPDMALAIREGRLELGDFVSEMQAGQDTIMAAAGDTISAGESWQMLKNNVALLVEGPAAAAFQWVADVSGGLLGLVSGLRDGSTSFRDLVPPSLFELFDQLRYAFADFKAFALDLWDNLAPLRDNLKESFANLAPTLERFKQIWTDLQPVLMVIGSLLAAVAAVVVGVVMGAINGLMGAIDGIVQVFGGLIGIISGVVQGIIAMFTGDWTGLEAANKKIRDSIVDVFAGLLSAVWGFLEGFVTGVVDFFVGLYDTLIGHSIIPDMINGIVDWFAKMPGRVMTLIENMVRSVLSWFGNLARGLVTAVSGLVSAVVRWFAGFGAKVLARVSAFPSLLLRKGRELVAGLWNGAKAVWASVSGWMRGLPRRVLASFGNVGRTLYGAGASIITGLWNGLKSVWGRVKSWFGDMKAMIPGWVKSALDIHSPSRVMMALGKQTMEGYAVGLQDMIPTIGRTMQDMAGVVAGKPLMTSAVPAATRTPVAGLVEQKDAGQQVVINFNQPVRTYSEVVSAVRQAQRAVAW